jgi:hypothetical protein
MNSRFDDLWASAADDGASCPLGVSAARNGVDTEVDQLLDAWLRERTERIECSLVLDQAYRLVAGLLAEGEINPRRRRQARRLIRAIRDVQKGDPGELLG